MTARQSQCVRNLHHWTSNCYNISYQTTYTAIMPQAITIGRNVPCVRTDRQTDGAQKCTIILNKHKSHFGRNDILGEKKNGVS